MRRLTRAGWRVQAVREQTKRISATEVREAIAAERPWQHLVPEAVRDWIMLLGGAERMRRPVVSGVPGK